MAHVKPAGFMPDDYDDWYDHVAEKVHHTLLPNDKTMLEVAVKEIAERVQTFLRIDWIAADPNGNPDG